MTSHGSVAVRALTLMLLLTLAIGACRRTGGDPSDARIAAKEGGSEITFGNRKAELPAGDVGKDAPPVTQDEQARRLGYRTASGQARIVYVVGDGLFVGPLVPFPPDFKAAPDVDHALAPLFEAAKTSARRLELVSEVKKQGGEAAVVRLLIDAAYVDDPSWDEARKTLSKENQTALADAMAVGLEKGKSAVLLRRAVSLVDIRAASRQKVVAARAKELADGSQEPRAVAALVRAVLASDKSEGASLGCTALKSATPDAGSSDERGVLVETALLAVAHARLNGDANACADANGAIEKMLMQQSCVPHLRCSDTAPLRWSDTSKQDEGLCTKAQVTDAIKAELDRPTSDILGAVATRTELFAYGALLASDRVPASFTTAHARRRYAITQPAEPACDNTVTPGAACHCDEATLRAAVCRAPAEAKDAASGFCKLEIDDKAKKIANVVAGTGTP